METTGRKWLMGYLKALWRYMHGKRPVHCWAGLSVVDTLHRPDLAWMFDGGDKPFSFTCFLLDGHWGRHRFTPDSEIMVTFPP